LDWVSKNGPVSNTVLSALRDDVNCKPNAASLTGRNDCATAEVALVMNRGENVENETKLQLPDSSH